MKWKKLGLIFAPEGSCEWMLTHASNPAPEHLHDDIFRVYFSSRDKEKRSSVGYVELNIFKPAEILKISGQPVITPGHVGGFDDSGVSMGCFVRDGSKRFIYYLGWNLGVTVPWRNSLGLAVCDDAEGAYRKVSRAPILDRSDEDPYTVSYPSVLKDGDLWKMWYGSNLSWGREQRDMAHIIKYAESADGFSWIRNNIICINFKSPDEYAISHPCVLKESGLYRMWYSYRGQAYRIGYAESPDGINWTRKDDLAGIDVSAEGWDSEMIEYPYVFDHGGERYMLYNGNGYGLTGFGLAVLEK